MPHSTDDLAEVAAELRAALLHADAVSVEALLDEEFELIGLAGHHRKEAVLAAVRPGALVITAAEVERERLRVLGELATTDTVLKLSGTHEGAPLPARLRIRATWRLAGDWSLVAAELRLATREPAGRLRP